jgi:gas vesicle protein
MDDNNKLGWFLAGAAIGAAVGLLYAPKSGRDTRNLLNKTSGEGLEAIESSGREFMDKSRDLYERGKQIAEDAADLFERGKKLVQG